MVYYLFYEFSSPAIRRHASVKETIRIFRCE
jgi:hypothetical protein